MEVKNRMTKNVETVGPENSLKDAAQKMKNLNVGALPVCENEHLVGILTDRDITVRSVAEARDANTTKVREVMSEHVEWCFDDQDEKIVAKKMKEKQIRRLAVINHEKKLVGMLSLGDLVTRGHKKLACDVLEKVSANPKE